VKKAQYDTEVNAANAEANLASTLQVKFTKSNFSKNYLISHHLIDLNQGFPTFHLHCPPKTKISNVVSPQEEVVSSLEGLKYF
jgi:Cu/Zn superoxide dismutase